MSRSTRSSTSEQIVVGRLLRPHGLRGELVAQSLTDNADRFEPGSRLGLAGRAEGVVIAASRRHRGRLLVALEGVNDRDSADALRGSLLTVERAEIPPAPADCYYHFELVGCVVEDRKEGVLGEVREVLEDGGGELLEVTSGGRVLLVPFVKAFLRGVDIEGRRIEVELPPGLVQECASTS